MEMRIFRGRKVLLGVTGSIAIYKAVDLASKLTQAGAEVDVVMSEAARNFVSSLSFHSVTGRRPHWDMWETDDHVQHVKLGESADIFVIAPATANTIAKMAHGLADNLLSVSVLAARCPLLLAPAMDGGMYENPATQANIEALKKLGAYIAGPVEGRMASGLSGLGRMVEPSELFGHIRYVLGRNGPLKGVKIMVTAGPTQEALDPVRLLTNRSSGRQGYALAQAALDAGADVTLISGPVSEQLPVGVELVTIRTALEMREAVFDLACENDALLMAAAVSDFRPASFSDEKIKKTELADETLSFQLDRNPDILAEIGRRRHTTSESGSKPAVLLGFAAETSDVIEKGTEKLRKKNLDYIAINDVSVDGAGFAGETNRIVLLSKKGQRWDLDLDSKAVISEQIIDILTPDLTGEKG